MGFSPSPQEPLGHRIYATLALWPRRKGDLPGIHESSTACEDGISRSERAPSRWAEGWRHKDELLEFVNG
jgi:hypothetical protein